MKQHLFFIAFIVLLFVCCKHVHENESGQKHEGHKIQFTAYSTDFELFVEADPFVVGEPSNVLCHFSNLPGFKALENGEVTIRLIANGSEAKQTLENPTRKGIYSFDIKPEAQGPGSMVFEIRTDRGAFELTLPDITIYGSEHDADEAAEEAEAGMSVTNTLVFTKEQSWKIDFATELPKNEPFGQVIKTIAHVRPAQGDEILVIAKTNGVVMLSDHEVLQGKSVFNGQVLFSISGSGLAGNNSSVRYIEAQNYYKKTKSDYERLRELAKDRIVSEKELLNAENQFNNAKAVYNNMKDNFTSSGQSVKSPMSGFIKQLMVKNGQYVEAGQPIVSISQNKALLLHAEVQQKYAPILDMVNSANIRTLHDNKTYTLEQLNGKVLSFGRNTTNDNFLIPVIVQIENNGGFLSGGFVDIYLKTLTNTQALTIPNSSLLEEQGYFFVLVQITPELFEKREVKPGATDGLKTEILKGTTQSERIVTIGAVLIKLAQSSNTLDAHSGHVH